MSRPRANISPRHERMFELLRQGEQSTLTCARLQTRDDAADLGFCALALASLRSMTTSPAVSDRAVRKARIRVPGTRAIKHVFAATTSQA